MGDDQTRSYEIGSVYIHAVVDESGKFRDKSAISWTALIASPKQWEAFSEGWLNLLRKHEIPYLHVKELMRWEGTYADKRGAWGNSGRESILDEFAELVRGLMSPGLGIGLNVSIDVRTWKALSSEQQKNIGRPDLAAFEVLMATVLVMNSTAFQSRFDIGIICDDEEEIAFHLYKFWRKARIRNRSLARKAVSLTFCNDEAFAPIQFADLLSHACYGETVRMIERPQDLIAKRFETMTSGVAFGRSVLDAQFMIEMAANPPGETALDIRFNVPGNPDGVQ